MPTSRGTIGGGAAGRGTPCRSGLGSLRRIAALAVLAGAALALAGCQLTRQNYDKVALGDTQDQVRKALGDPRYVSPDKNEWTYAADDPRDLTGAVIRFDDEKKVIGKKWFNPDKPWENDRAGEAP